MESICQQRVVVPLIVGVILVTLVPWRFFLKRLAAQNKLDAAGNHAMSNDEVSELIFKAITKARENFGVADTGVGGVKLTDRAAWEAIFRSIY